jgi:hypothetical protein
MPLGFLKMHANGDDFVVIDMRGTPGVISSDVARRLGDRHRGIGRVDHGSAADRRRFHLCHPIRASALGCCALSLHFPTLTCEEHSARNWPLTPCIIGHLAPIDAEH